MSAVWIYRDPRSGSSAFSELIATQLGRFHSFIHYAELEKIRKFGITKPPFDQSDSVLYTTHTFELLEHMTLYNDPLLIRCTRKDKAEQCLSFLFMQYANLNVSTDDWFQNIRSLDDVPAKIFDRQDPIYFSKKEVFDYMRYNRSVDQAWSLGSANHRSCVVYYEDLCNGIDLPELGLTECKLSDRSATLKLPEYKSRLILNEKHVREWVVEYQTLHP